MTQELFTNEDVKRILIEERNKERTKEQDIQNHTFFCVILFIIAYMFMYGETFHWIEITLFSFIIGTWLYQYFGKIIKFFQKHFK